MPNTYTQIHIHLIFAVADRRSLIHGPIRDGLYRYMTGIIQQRGQKMLAINGMPDHVHLLIGLRPDLALSDLVRDVKAFSSKHVNDQRWTRGKFEWQKGYGAFPYSRSQLSAVIRYIEHQEQHHRARTFRQEYEELLRLFQVEHDPRYLFTWIEDGKGGEGTGRS